MEKRVLHAGVRQRPTAAALCQSVGNRRIEGSGTESVRSIAVQRNSAATVFENKIALSRVDIDGVAEGRIEFFGPPVIGRVFWVVPGSKEAPAAMISG